MSVSQETCDGRLHRDSLLSSMLWHVTLPADVLKNAFSRQRRLTRMSDFNVKAMVIRMFDGAGRGWMITDADDPRSPPSQPPASSSPSNLGFDDAAYRGQALPASFKHPLFLLVALNFSFNTVVDSISSSTYTSAVVPDKRFISPRAALVKPRSDSASGDSHHFITTSAVYALSHIISYLSLDTCSNPNLHTFATWTTNPP